MATEYTQCNRDICFKPPLPLDSPLDTPWDQAHQEVNYAPFVSEFELPRLDGGSERYTVRQGSDGNYRVLSGIPSPLKFLEDCVATRPVTLPKKAIFWCVNLIWGRDITSEVVQVYNQDMMLANLTKPTVLIDDIHDLTKPNTQSALFHNAVKSKKFHEAFKILQIHNINVNHADENGKTALHYLMASATRFEYDQELLEILLRKGASLTQKDAGGFTPLDVAQRPDLLKPAVAQAVNNELKQPKPNLNRKFIDDKTYMHFAAMCGATDTVKIILRNTPISMPRNSVHLTPLMLAVINNHMGVVKVFLGCRNAPEQLKASTYGIGNTSLHLAYERGNDELIQYLIKHGADTKVENKNGHIPSHMPVIDQSEAESEDTSPLFHRKH